jgi:hypothetical protein
VLRLKQLKHLLVDYLDSLKRCSPRPLLPKLKKRSQLLAQRVVDAMVMNVIETVVVIAKKEILVATM